MKKFLFIILIVNFSFSQTKNVKVNFPTYIINGAEIGFEFSNKKGKTSHEFTLITMKAPSFDKNGDYDQFGVEYKMKNFIFNKKALNGFYIAAPIVNFINFKREYDFNSENIKTLGVGSVAGYQFFLLNTPNSNLTLDINMGGNFQIPYDIKNIDQYFNSESDQIDGLFLLPKYLRFNISIGYAFL
jgi:hypothetical protein